MSRSLFTHLSAFLRSSTRLSQSIHSLPAFTSRSTTRVRILWQSPFSRAAQQSQQIRLYNRGFNYQRFQSNIALLRRWSQHPHFYYHLGGIAALAGTFYAVNLEDVPVSHRRRFRIVSYDKEAGYGATMYQQTMQEYAEHILPPSHPYYKMAQRVANRLIPHCGLPDVQWELNVIDSDQKNAFVGPGGKIFVFAGMFDICKTDDSLAAVIGHEIAHNVAHHAAEKASSGILVMGAAILLSLFAGEDFGQSILLDLIFSKPGSRVQESEADYIGLLMMSEACYDPRAAVEMWATMEKLEQNQGVPPQWLSTHPSNHNRREKITGWLPQAEEKLRDSGCGEIRPRCELDWTDKGNHELTTHIVSEFMSTSMGLR